MDPENLLPVEQRAREAAKRLGAAGRGLMTRGRGWWADHFVDNPLLRREAGLMPGRPRWKAPLVWAFVVLGVMVLLRQGQGIVYLALEIHHQGDIEAWGSSIIALSDRWLFWALRWFSYLWSLLTPFLFIWLVARAWARDRDPSLRDQIAASPLTVRQLIGARTFLWMAPILVFTAVELTSGMAQAFVRELALPEGSALSIGAGISSLPWRVLREVISLSVDLALLGWATRITLMWHRPALTVATVGAGLLALWAWSFAFFTVFSTFGPPWFLWMQYWVQELLPLAVAVAAWWRLPRHVARVYGMRP